MKKRILSILLSLSMVLLLFPVAAFAQGETPEDIINIAVTVDEPVLGQTPDFTPEFTANPSGSVELSEFTWFMISADAFTGTSEDVWDEMSEDDVFEEGYYYSVDLYFTPNENYSLNENMTGTVNGKDHDDTYGSVYDEFLVSFFNEAYVCGFFDNFAEYTLSVPFNTTVSLGDYGIPKETEFTLKIVGANASEEIYADVNVNASVTTNGAGSYTGTMTLTGPFRELWYMLSEGAFVQQVNAGEEGWTYDDTVWGLLLDEDEIAELSLEDEERPGYSLYILPVICEEDEDGIYYDLDWEAKPLDEMSFTNVYTAHKYTQNYDKSEHWEECECGDVQNKELHKYGEWVVTKEATKSEEGEKERTCTICPHKETEVIAKLIDEDTSNEDTKKPETPNTGDNSNASMWLAMLVVSAAGVICMSDKRKRSTQAK